MYPFYRSSVYIYIFTFTREIYAGSYFYIIVYCVFISFEQVAAQRTPLGVVWRCMFTCCSSSTYQCLRCGCRDRVWGVFMVAEKDCHLTREQRWGHLGSAPTPGRPPSAPATPSQPPVPRAFHRAGDKRVAVTASAPPGRGAPAGLCPVAAGCPPVPTGLGKSRCGAEASDPQAPIPPGPRLT